MNSGYRDKSAIRIFRYQFRKRSHFCQAIVQEIMSLFISQAFISETGSLCSALRVLIGADQIYLQTIIIEHLFQLIPIRFRSCRQSSRQRA